MSKPRADYYGLLGIGRYASLPEIRRAYKQKALETHPDKHPEDGDSMFKLVSEAYACLSDDKARRQFDESYFGPRPYETSSSASFSRRTRSGSGGKENGESATTFSPEAEDFENEVDRHSRRSSRTNSSSGGGATSFKPRHPNFQDVYKFDLEMAAKKGGFFGDFASWRAGIEEEKAELQRQFEEKQKEKEKLERAAELRQQRRASAPGLHSVYPDNDTLHEWQEEMLRWEEQRRKEEQAERERKLRELATEKHSSLQQQEKFRQEEQRADDILEQIRKERSQHQAQRDRVYVPTEVELDAKDESELKALATILQSRLEYIQRLQEKRRLCIACRDKLKMGGVYHCGHPQATCQDCVAQLRGCPKCHALLHTSPT